MKIRARSVLAAMTMITCTGLVGAGCVGEPSSETDTDVDSEESLAQVEGEVLGSGSSPPRNGITLSNDDDGFKLPSGLNLGNGKQTTYGINLANGTITPKADLKTWLDGAPVARRHKLEALIECALPSVVTIKLTYGGSTYAISGKYKLGPSILSGLMSVQEQQQVSACILARVNQAGTSDYIKMVSSPNFGSKENLPTPSSGPTGSFDGVEASFAGNVFTYPPKAFMCINGKFKLPNQICNSRACSKQCDKTPDANNQGSCSTFDLALDCSKVCTKNLSGSAEDHHYQCNDTGHGNTWAYTMTTYVVQHSAGQICSGDWDCFSGVCNESTGKCG